MATNDKKVAIYNKRMVPQEGWSTHFLDYLVNMINDTTRAAFLQPGVLSDKDITIYSDTNDTFSLNISDASRGVDGSGNIIDLSNLNSNFYEDIPFENSNTIIYYVGIRYQEIPDDVESNPRNRDPEYPWELDTIGEQGNPDSVTDNTTYIRLILNTILESSVDHSGQAVRAWLKKPVSPDSNVAYYDGTVEYSAPNNYIDIPYSGTQGPLGQTAPGFPISLTASDYTVWVKGVSWFKNDISGNNNYVFIGTVQGSGTGTTPTTFDITDQKKTFLISLDRAYRANSPDTPAPGRTIVADKYAVVVEQSATSNKESDSANSALLIDKLNETINFGTGIRVLQDYSTLFDSPFLALKVLSDGVGNDLQKIEPVTLASGGDTVTFTRAGIDLTTFSPNFFSSGGALIFFTGMPDSSINSVYRIKGGGITTNTLDVSDLDTTTVAFPAGQTGNATVLIPSISFGSSDLLAAAYTNIATHFLAIPKSKDGINLQMFGNPSDSEKMVWLSACSQYNDKTNCFLRLYSGKLRLTGGGATNINTNRTDTDVKGNGVLTIDKRDIANLDTTWEPTEASQEQGFDYRGNAWGKDLTSDAGPFQFSSLTRIPFSDYDSGNDNIRAEEAFTQSTSTRLRLTRVGADVSNIPVASSNGIGLLIAEIEFDTPNSADGLYLTYDKANPDLVDFRKIDGTSPSFPVGTGNVRFYAGVLTGPYSAPSSGNSDSWVQTIVPPTQQTGGLRLGHKTDNAIGSTDDRFLVAAIADSNFAFAVRDGGQVFARALTTKGATSGVSNLPQWDSIETSLLHANIINLLEGTREIVIPDTLTSCDVIKRSSGVWTVTRVIPIFGGTPSVSGTATWASPGAAATSGLLQVVANGSYRKPFIPPQNASKIVSVTAHVDPQIDDGTVNAFGIEVFRAAKGGTTNQSMITTGMVRASASTGSPQDVTVTTDQNNGTVNNDTYQYYIHIEGSNPTGDTLYSFHVTYETSKQGESFFDIG